MKYTIIQSELIEWLKSYDGERFHAIVSDPPYALLSIAKRFGPGQAPAKAGADGRHERLSRGFMGQTWDGFDSLEDYQSWVSEWASLLIEKVLYPGALCLFFGGTRTWHHLAVGLENGGFEIYDSLMWLYGSGFPKSHDISKGIDRAAGKDRTVIGKINRGDVQKAKEKGAGYLADPANRGNVKQFGYGEEDITLPATDEARLWDGWGTALKPSWEPIVLCRAPRKGQTFASLALEFGSGALNIDGSRISGSWEWGTQTDIRGGRFGGNQARPSEGDVHDRNVESHPSGRWPANILLSHHEDCQLLGEIIATGRVINRWKEGMKPFGDAAGEAFESEQLPPETIERWACVAECPVRQLDDQAGIKSSGSGNIIRKSGKGFIGATFGVESRPAGTEMMSYGDSGHVSRFFYCGKASRTEKDAGLETFFWKRVDRGYVKISEAEWIKLDKNKRAKLNIHPTVKPLSLIQYLATLVLPPELEDDRRIFIPFSGSGSEIIGALKAGWDVAVGLEAEAQYNEIAEARIKHNLGMFVSKMDF
jgi:site-specific DNA-methyltransferase (adenine-specific)